MKHGSRFSIIKAKPRKSIKAINNLIEDLQYGLSKLIKNIQNGKYQHNKYAAVLLHVESRPIYLVNAALN